MLAILCLVAVAWGAPATSHGEVIYVKILVDEEERTNTDVWQHRLKNRLDAASAIIHQYTDIQFAVAEFAVWHSDNRLADLNRTLAEFEHEVDPAPAQIAIGFSSQYRFQKGLNGLGGTRGPLHSHVLLRESSPTIREPERLEALVHELGHFLGAAHSRLSTSVMRPVVGDGRARDPAFRIGFDERNARIIQWVGAEVSTVGVRRFSQLAKLTQDRLLTEYRALDRELPKDPAAKHFVELIQAAQSGGREARPNGVPQAGPTSTGPRRIIVAPRANVARPPFPVLPTLDLPTVPSPQPRPTQPSPAPQQRAGAPAADGE